MTKNMIKEMIIALLLCLAIILLLGILLYDYVPMTKTIPNPVSYTTPNNVKQELAESSTIDEEQIIMTYEVDSTDLNNYKRIQNYKPGKANPFSSYETTTTNTDTTQGKTENGGSANIETTGNTTGTSGNATSNTTGDASNVPTSDDNNTSGGHFFQQKDIK